MSLFDGNNIDAVFNKLSLRVDMIVEVYGTEIGIAVWVAWLVAIDKELMFTEESAVVGNEMNVFAAGVEGFIIETRDDAVVTDANA